MVSIRTLFAVCTILTFAAFPLYAQYVEIYRVDNLANELGEEAALGKVAAHLSVSADSLRQEKKEYGITLGQVYFAHQLAKFTKSDSKAVMKEFQSGKAWGVLAKEKNLNMDDLRKDSRQLED